MNSGNGLTKLENQQMSEDVPGGPRVIMGPDSVEMASPQSLISAKSRGEKIMIEQANVEEVEEEKKE